MGLPVAELIRASALTLGDFTIDVNTATGTDSNVVLIEQAGATAHGAFATVEGALDAIPDHVIHTVTISLADGITPLNATFPFGDMSRFVFMAGGSVLDDMGKILFTSASGLTIEGGTVQMDVASGSETLLVLQSDPGLTVDQFKGSFVEVVAGTGIGQVRGIRTHTGVNFTVPAQWNPPLDGTSKVEIRKPAAEMTITPTLFSVNGSVPFSTAGAPAAGLEFDRIDVSHATGTFFSLVSLPLTIGTGCRMIRTGIVSRGGDVYLRSCILDGKAAASVGIFLDNSFLRSVQTTEAWVITDMTLNGILVSSTNNGVAAFLFQGSVEGCPTGIMVLGALSKAKLDSRIDGLNSQYGVEVSEGAVAQVVPTANTITGSTNDFRLDGVDEETYAELTANNSIIGSIYRSKLMIG